ncbi:MAG: DMT family transporter [Pirellulales bacterium]
MAEDRNAAENAPDPLEPIPLAIVEAAATDEPRGRDARLAASSPPSLWRARCLVLAAAVLWSTSGFFAKAPWFVGWSGATLAFWRALFASLVLWPLVRRPEWTWKLIPMTLLFAGMNYSYLTSMSLGTAANAIWLQFTAPAWVLVLGVAIFKERAVGRDWLLVAFAAAGVALILYFESRGASRAAVVWGLVAGICYAGVVLALRHLRAHDPAWLAAINHTVTVAVLAPLALAPWFFAGSEGVAATGAHFPHGIQWPLLAAFGLVQMGLPYVLFARGLQRIPGHEATGIGLVEPILLPIWTYLAWNERPAWWTIAGGSLILTGLVIRYVNLAQPSNTIELAD